MRKAAILGDLDQLLIARDQLRLRMIDLAIKHELLGRKSKEFGKPTVKVEWAKFTVRAISVRPDRGSNSCSMKRTAGIRRIIRGRPPIVRLDCRPLMTLGLKTEEAV